MGSVNPFCSGLMSNTSQAVVAKADDSVTEASDSRSPKPTHIPQTTFDRMPTEIRLKIYEELLLTPHTIFITLAKEHDCDQSVLASLLLVNKGIRHEVLGWLKKTNICCQDGVSPDIQIKNFSIFNPNVTTFCIVAMRGGAPVIRDFMMLSLWHLLAILYQCDSNHRVRLRSYDLELSDDEIEEFFSSWQDSNHEWSDMCPNWVQISRMLYADFNAEFGYDIKFQYLTPMYYDSSVQEQLLRIPFAYHRALANQNLDPEEIIKQVCLLEEIRVGDANDPFDGFYEHGDTEYHYSGDDWEACRAWKLFDWNWVQHWGAIFHDFCEN